MTIDIENSDFPSPVPHELRDTLIEREKLNQWNPDLMKVFTAEELIAFRSALEYLNQENDIPYQNSFFETDRDNGEDPSGDEPESDPDNVHGYKIFRTMEKKLTKYAKEDVTYGEFFTHPRFSCNSSSWYGREDEVEGNS